MINILVKIPTDLVVKAAEKSREIPCLRFQTGFTQYEDGTWTENHSCHGHGNGLGAGFTCKEDCRLRITDLNKCVSVSPERYGREISFLVQQEFYGEGSEEC